MGISLNPVGILVADALRGKPAVLRANEWPAVSKTHLRSHPFCFVCRTRKKVEVHHVVPFHVDPLLELVLANLITLCRVHHFLFGHLGDWKSWNVNCREDCAEWALRIVERPRLRVAA